ncbi:MAG: cysteine desulfurase family protein [Desulfobaccales bacterium]
MIYLDHAATTPLDPSVDEMMRPFGREIFGNPSSAHAAGRQARFAIDEARDRVADRLGARAAEIIFTSGGTEADNLALLGVARAMRARGNHIITTAVEHHAVLASCAALEREGFQVSYLRPERDGLFTPAQVEAAMTPQTILVSVGYANNEVGVVQPIAALGRLCRARRLLLHSDAVQAAGELPLSVHELQVDLLSLSAHKIYGPKGVGALYVRAGTRLQPLSYGGGQEQERRAGTENVAGIIGLAGALERTQDPTDIARQRRFRDTLIEGLLAIPDSRLHGSHTQRLAGNVNIGFAGVPGETLQLALDLEGIACSTGAACSAGAVTPSHVLLAMGFTRTQAQEALRLTLGRGTSPEEIRQTITTITALVSGLRKRGAS